MGDVNEGDLDVVLVSDGEPVVERVVVEKVEGRTLTDEEYQELVRKGDASSRIVAPLTSLVERMQGGQQAANVQVPVESEEEFYARMEQQAFMPGQFGKVMGEVSKRQMAPVIGRMGQIVLDQAKRLMRVDPEKGETFRKYEGEIEKEVQQVPAQFRGPEVYEEVYQKVLARKQPELMDERLEKERERIRAEIIKEYGLEDGGGGAAQPARKPMQSLGQRASAPNAEGGQARQSLRLFESERDRMVNIGMNPTDPQQVQSFLKNHPRRK